MVALPETISRLAPSIRRCSPPRWIEDRSHTNNTVWGWYFDAQNGQAPWDRLFYGLDWYGLELLHLASCSDESCREHGNGALVHYRQGRGHYRRTVGEAVASMHCRLLRRAYARLANWE